HGEIRGELEEAVGRFPVGTPFRATDPALLKWVLAATYSNTRAYYERFVRPLGEAERQQYYEEIKYLGQLLCLPPRELPRRYQEFDDYISRMLEGDDLAVSRTARELSVAFLRLPKLAWPIGPLAEVLITTMKSLVSGLLPDRVRELNGLPWRPSD